MIGGLVLLWVVTCFAVMGYGLSNGAVTTLSLPRWTSLAIAGLGFVMLMAMFAFVLYGEAADLSLFQSGGGGGSGGD